MPLFQKQRKDNLLWGIWKMEESLDQLLSFFVDPTDYRISMREFVAESRRKEWLSVRVLLSELCGEEKQILYFSNGKPYLADGSYHISISHTRGYVALALSSSESIGIDIEQCSNRVCKVRSKFMHPEEEQEVGGVYEPNYLLLYWSAKEALFKLLGEQEVDFKEHLRILPFIYSSHGQCFAKEFKTTEQHEFRIDYYTHADYVLTLCSYLIKM